jgi:hypothetical protein
MPANLSSFQSAIQLVSGANLAVFALPGMGQGDMDLEKRRWSALLSNLEESAGQLWVEAFAASSAFAARCLDEDVGRQEVRRFALIVSVIAALYLVFASIAPDRAVDVFTWIVLLLGLAPALALVARHADTTTWLNESRNRRAELTLAARVSVAG